MNFLLHQHQLDSLLQMYWYISQLVFLDSWFHDFKFQLRCRVIWQGWEWDWNLLVLAHLFRKSLFYFCNAVVNEIVLDSIETIFCVRLKSLVPLCSQSLVSMWDSSSSKCSPGFSFTSLIVTQLLLALIAFDQCQSCPYERLCCIYW